MVNTITALMFYILREVTAIIVVGLLLLSSFGCRKETPHYQLPDSIERPAPGSATFITPRALVDSLNKGVELKLVFIEELEAEDSSHVIPIPGMVKVPSQNLYYIRDTLDIKDPVYFICLYGDYSKRTAEYWARDGYTCYYLDGGTYRLSQQIQRYGWKILPRRHPVK